MKLKAEVGILDPSTCSWSICLFIGSFSQFITYHLSYLKLIMEKQQTPAAALNCHDNYLGLGL